MFTALILGVPTLDVLAERLDRNNLLVFRDASGAPAPVRSVRDWLARRAEILAGAHAVMGPLPGRSKRVPLDMKVDEEVDCGSYVRRAITYLAEPESRVPAYLLIPKAVLDGSAGAPRPGVLCLMGTNRDLGSKVVVGLGGTTQAAINRGYGQDLVEKGYVIIAPYYPFMGNYRPELKKLGYQSGTMKAIWDNIRAIDLMAAIPGVKQGGYGAIGHSLGGHNAIYTALFDERISVIVSSCGFDSYLDYRDASAWRPGQGWTQELYMPKLLDTPRAEIPFDFHELIGALAPRPFFVNAPVGDSNFKWQSVDRVVAAAAQIYRLYEVPALIRVEHPDSAHDFPPAVKELAYAWLDRALQ
ncbi:MAG: alpha/beta hydrolase [Verrucomicrobia bacterium]|nr:alpha/beta hydrolase [Verrucomicrobiota bacterium]